MVTEAEIKRFTHDIAERFRPDRIILFGSHARGEARPDSDVDLLVVLDHNGRNVEQAIRILEELRPRFALDLLVRTPADLSRRLAMNDLFIREIVEQGHVIYERDRS